MDATRIQYQRALIAQLEGFTGGTVATSRLLQVDYTGCYASWKAGRKEMPKYIIESILAHIALAQTKNTYVKDHHR